MLADLFLLAQPSRERYYPAVNVSPAHTCSLCNGTGKLDEILKSILKDADDLTCPACSGTGKVEENPE